MSHFITFEGIEGSGKSTQAARLADALKRAGHEVVTTREPGGTELGRKLRAILLEADAVAPTAETELFLYLADRAEHVSRLIRPALDRGAVVICDRFSDSTLAYQAWGRGLDVEMVRRADRFARAGTRPDRTILLESCPGGIAMELYEVQVVRLHPCEALVDSSDDVLTGKHVPP